MKVGVRNPFYIKLGLYGNPDIRYIADEAIKIAKRFDMPVHFVLNGVEVVVRKDHQYVDVWYQYENKIKEKRRRK